MKNLPVAYKSQWDTDAGGTKNDCGPTSIAQILNYYGENLTTDQVFAATGAGLGLISIAQMQKAIASFGYTSHYEKGQSPARLKELIDQDMPVIMLVHYGSLISTQDKTFKGGHFFTLVGYRDDGYFVNDSNFWGDFRKDGDHHNYSKAELERAWSDSSLDSNPICALIYIERKKPTVDQDQENALGLLRSFKQKENIGNLEGAMRALLADHDRVVSMTADLQSSNVKLSLLQKVSEALSNLFK